MTQRRLNTVAVILGTLLLWCCGCESMDGKFSLKKPTARLTGLQLEDVKLDSATLLFDIEVDNPYPVALPLTNLDYDLATAGNTFLSGVAAIQTTIPANSSKIVSLPARINYLGMFKAVKDIRPGSIVPYIANVGLSVDPPALKPLRLPLKKEGELKLPTVQEVGAQDFLNLLKGL